MRASSGSLDKGRTHGGGDGSPRPLVITSSARPGAMLLSLLLAVVAAALLATLSGCEGPRRQAEGAEAQAGNGAQEEENVFAVTATEPVRGEIMEYLTVNGDVEPRSSVDVYPDTDGELLTMRVRTGSTVERDEVIAEVDRSRPGQEFVPSPVRSPIGGTVTRRYVDVGATVSSQTPIVEVADTERLEINTEVGERRLGRVQEGQRAIVFLEAYPGEGFEARVTDLSPVLDPATRTMGVTLELTRRYERVKAGMFVEIRLITRRRTDVVKVHSDAVVRRFDTPYVFVIGEDGTVEQREVRVGISAGEHVEITDGLEGNERIVYAGHALLDDGVRVRAVDEVQPLPAEHDIARGNG
ncbi:MAG: efflux RND transporter periplasmic adaptor subunit [Spirochaetaceae bacterium]